MSDPQFRLTRWSLVLRARGDGDEAHRAMGELCEAYWFPLYAWCRRSGLAAAEAEDLVQGFFLRVIEKDLFAAADASRGKLRTFLLTALQRHVRDEQGKARAERRGGGRVVSFDAVEAEAWYAGESIDGESADQMFDRQWALTVLDQAIGRLEQEAAGRGKGEAFGALRPFLTREGSAAEYERCATPLGMNGGSFKVAVHRLRAKFRDALRAEVAETQPDGEGVDAEIRHLMNVLGASGLADSGLPGDR
ncbi:sigma-70 family RNA polymerase sigma factor [Luteolibacter arcticus]|uniref:Sigma-70 family RNA polymerase sigma factor n=1 Tax=Luteolibacter arcticus TaxID=1581411 RepID=A0ABT3GBQ3_9BACT|nr:sigma-70 family RNA polymerase sigma factor [Luteolibacter arcticus]MCW1921057.1 sigma-70 family RNA polymerase sigma factor [Luteolibacter arcticus]